MSKLALTVLAGAALVLAAGQTAAARHMTMAEAEKMCHPTVNTGLPSPTGENPAEAANKRVIFAWNCEIFVDHDPEDAFKTYVDPSFCDHTHLITHGTRACGTYAEALRDFHNMRSSAPAGDIELPMQAAVDGEIVTMYGEGIDIFRVHDGKITDHWDGGPAGDVNIKGPPPGFKPPAGQGPGG